MTRRARLGPAIIAAVSMAAAPVAIAAGGSGSSGGGASPNGGSSSPSGTSSSPSKARARLQGQFLLAGKITVAHDVRGEHVGQTVMRKWVFTPVCAHGACGHIQLYRARSNGHDRLTLRRRSPGLYIGTGAFYAPLKCGSTIYHKGQYVPFAISVRVVGAAIQNGIDVASSVRATYDNKSRTNRTPCLAFLGHDAAKYHGHLSQ